MSSRVFRPGDTPAATPVIWRQVRPQAGGSTGVTAGVPPGFAEQAAQLQQQCEHQVREARVAGLNQGEAAGRSRAAAEMQPVIERLSRSIDELGHMRARLRTEAEADLIQLSLSIARRVLRRELAIDPEALHGLVLAALEKLQGQEICRVKVHPSHAALVTDCLRQSVTGSTVEVIADSSREPGDVVFETDRGNLDASVDSQLQEIERGLTDRLRKRS